MARPATRWNKESGPGEAAFADPAAAQTTATFSKPGAYILALTATDGQLSATGRVGCNRRKPASRHSSHPADHPPLFDLQPLLERPGQSAHRKLDPPLHGQNRRHQPPRGRLGQFRPGPASNWPANPTPGTKAPSSPTPGSTTPSKPCAWPSASSPARTPPWPPPKPACGPGSMNGSPRSSAPRNPTAISKPATPWTTTAAGPTKPITKDTWPAISSSPALAHHVMTGGKDTRHVPGRPQAGRLLVPATSGPPPKRAWYEGHQAFEMAPRPPGPVRRRPRRPRQGPGLCRPGQIPPGLPQGRPRIRPKPPARHGSNTKPSATPCAPSTATRAWPTLRWKPDPRTIKAPSAPSGPILVQKKYYVTGGVGSGETSEGFGKDYSLPNHALLRILLRLRRTLLPAQNEPRLAGGPVRRSLRGKPSTTPSWATSTWTPATSPTPYPLDSAGARYKWHVCPWLRR